MSEPIKYKYTARPATWFKAGSEAFLREYSHIDSNGSKYGIFEGTYVVEDTDYDKYWFKKGYKVGDEVQMRELCAYEEFDIQTIYTEDI